MTLESPLRFAARALLFVIRRWNDPIKIPMKNGTTSLVLKHMLAMHDMLMRRVSAAVVCEDDVDCAPSASRLPPFRTAL